MLRAGARRAVGRDGDLRARAEVTLKQASGERTRERFRVLLRR